MLVPVRQLYPIRLATPTDSTTFVLETNLPVSPVLQPKMFFLNTSLADSVRVRMNHVLSLGVSDDPLLTGTFTTNLFDEVVGPGELLWHVFPSVSLSDGLVYHEVTVDVTGTSLDVVLHTWLEGVFEESLKVLPTFAPIVI